MTLKDESPGSEGAQYATGEEWRKSHRKNDKNLALESDPKTVNVL